MYKLNDFISQLFLLKHVSKHRSYWSAFTRETKWKSKKKIYLLDQVKFWINTRHQFNPHTYSTCLHLYFGSFISLSSGSQFSLTCSIVPGMKLYPNILYLFLSEFNRRVRTFRVFKALRTEWTLGGVFLYRKKNWFICTGATWKTFVKYSNFFPRQIASHRQQRQNTGPAKDRCWTGFMGK